MTNLQDRLLDAHARDARMELVGLYTEAADATDDIEAACFYLTHAYVFGLEMNHPDVPALYDRLKAHGRV